MTIWQLYFLTRMEKLQDLLCGVAAIFLILTACGAIGILISMVEDAEKETKAAVYRWVKIGIAGSSIFGLLTIAIPSNQDLAIILGGHFVTNQEEIKKLPANVAKTLNDFLERYQEKEEKK